MEGNSYIIRALDKEDKYFRRFERGAARFTADIDKAASYRQRNTASIAAEKLVRSGHKPEIIDKQSGYKVMLDKLYAKQKAERESDERRKAQLRSHMTEKMLSGCIGKIEQAIPSSMLRYMVALSIPVYPKDITPLGIKRQVPVSSSKLSSFISYLSTSNTVRIAEYGRRFCYPDEEAMEAAIRLTESDEMSLDDAEDTIEELLSEVLENGLQKTRQIKTA